MKHPPTRSFRHDTPIHVSIRAGRTSVPHLSIDERIRVLGAFKILPKPRGEERQAYRHLHLSCQKKKGTNVAHGKLLLPTTRLRDSLCPSPKEG